MPEGNENLTRPDRRSMSRRRGQRGCVVKSGNSYYVTFYADVPGERRRRRMTVKLGRVSGPEKISKTEAKLIALEVIEKSGVNTAQHLALAQGASTGITFREQAERFMEHLQNRKRRPAKLSTVVNWRCCLSKHLNPLVGDTPLWRVNNTTLKAIVAEMINRKLSPKSIRNYIGLFKMIVGSAKDQDGEQLYPRKWNDEFADVPLVGAQHTPTLTREELEGVLARSGGQHKLLFALLAGTGMRIGEALALEIRHVSPDCRLIRVEQSAWNGQIQTPKTRNATREIDLCPELASLLQAHLDGRTQGFVFGNGRPIASPSMILKHHLHRAMLEMGKPILGFHAFRRFRVTHLRRSAVPEDLIRFWIGHAPQSVTDLYSHVAEDRASRSERAEKVGLGFSIPETRVGAA